MKTQKFIAEGTTCGSCSTIIKNQALKVDGVEDVSFSYETEKGSVTFDESKTNIDQILSKIEEKGYTCYILEGKKKSSFGWIFAVLGIVIAGYYLLNYVGGFNIPQISQNMSYGLILVVGLLTGFHCVSMCGGFVVSYTAKHAKEGTKSYKSHFSYGLGKTISYTIMGAIFGLLGSIVAFTPMMRGVVGLLAGLFLIIFGLNMLNLIPWLRKIRFHTPSFVNKFVSKETKKHNSPLVIGLLNGLMIACGPLQAIYIMAAGTGSWLEGAKILFIFALGTLPVMLSFGFLTSFISSKATQKILKASGVIVIILGLIMMNRGLALTGTGDITNIFSANPTGNVISDGEYQTIKMDVTRSGFSPNKFVLEKGVPVKWEINAKELTGCNREILVPDYDLDIKLKQGIQTVEFTPTEEGTISWSCWMGMIPGSFIVKESVGDEEEVQQVLDAMPEQKAGSCGSGCGCGGK